MVLNSPIGGVLGVSSATGKILSDDRYIVLPTISVGINAQDASKYEGDSGVTPFTFTVSREGDISDWSEVQWVINDLYSNGNYLANRADLSLNSSSAGFYGTIIFAPKESTAKITVNVVGDASIEKNETFAITLFEPIGTIIKTAMATATILDDDGIPKLTIVALDANKMEGDHGNVGGKNTPFTFQVTREGDLTGTTSVNWSLPNVVAQSGQTEGSELADLSDFTTTATEGTVTFAPGQSTQIITLGVSGDRGVEKNESFTVHLSQATGGALIKTSDAVGIIVTMITGSISRQVRPRK